MIRAVHILRDLVDHYLLVVRSAQLNVLNVFIARSSTYSTSSSFTPHKIEKKRTTLLPIHVAERWRPPFHQYTSECNYFGSDRTVFKELFRFPKWPPSELLFLIFEIDSSKEQSNLSISLHFNWVLNTKICSEKSSHYIRIKFLVLETTDLQNKIKDSLLEGFEKAATIFDAALWR